MPEIDWKNIGLVAKDIVLGIAGAAAGASGGPAGAEAVGKVGTGLDKALAMGGIVADDKADQGKRAQNFDRDGKPPPPKLAAAPPAPPPPEPESTPVEGGPLVGDNKTTAEELRSLGWTRQQIFAILEGPERTDIATLTNRQVGGRRALGVEGRRVATVGGKSSPAVRGKAVRGVSGSAVPTVAGRKVGLDDDEGSA